MPTLRASAVRRYWNLKLIRRRRAARTGPHALEAAYRREPEGDVKRSRARRACGSSVTARGSMSCIVKPDVRALAHPGCDSRLSSVNSLVTSAREPCCRCHAGVPLVRYLTVIESLQNDARYSRARIPSLDMASRPMHGSYRNSVTTGAVRRAATGRYGIAACPPNTRYDDAKEPRAGQIASTSSRLVKSADAWLCRS